MEKEIFFWEWKHWSIVSKVEIQTCQPPTATNLDFWRSDRKFLEIDLLFLEIKQ
jgi:hypothetical protein